MSNQSDYPIDPMTAFYAAVTAVENGQVNEIELEFRNQSVECEFTMTMSIRKEVRSFSAIPPIINKPKDE